MVRRAKKIVVKLIARPGDRSTILVLISPAKDLIKSQILASLGAGVCGHLQYLSHKPVGLVALLRLMH